MRRAVETFWEPAEDFWALEDVTFEVARGETLGVVGRNGAGKTPSVEVIFAAASAVAKGSANAVTFAPAPFAAANAD